MESNWQRIKEIYIIVQLAFKYHFPKQKVESSECYVQAISLTSIDGF